MIETTIRIVLSVIVVILSICFFAWGVSLAEKWTIDEWEQRRP